MLRILPVYPLSFVGYFSVSCGQRATSGSPLFQEAKRREQIFLMSVAVYSALSKMFLNAENAFPGFLIYEFLYTFRYIGAQTHMYVSLSISADTYLY